MKDEVYYVWPSQNLFPHVPIVVSCFFVSFSVYQLRTPKEETRGALCVYVCVCEKSEEILTFVYIFKNNSKN